MHQFVNVNNLKLRDHKKHKGQILSIKKLLFNP
jgi:hypothetical protein